MTCPDAREALADRLRRIWRAPADPGPLSSSVAPEDWLRVADAVLAETAALRERLARAEREQAALAKIVREAWDAACDGSDYGGDRVQEEMVAAGLAVAGAATAEEADGYEIEEGDSVYRLTDLGKSALATPTPGAPDAG